MPTRAGMTHESKVVARSISRGRVAARCPWGWWGGKYKPPKWWYWDWDLEGGRTRTVWSPRGEGYGKSEAAEMWGGVCVMGYPTGQWIGGA